MSEERRQLLDIGYIVLRDFFDPRPLAEEVDRALTDGFGPTDGLQTFPAGKGTVSVQYVPMMCERTPVSVELAGALAKTAAVLLNGPVLPGRAKGSRYQGDTSWHRDSEHNVASLGCIAYLDSLTGSTGALRVLPRSHTDRHVDLPEDPREGGVPLETVPGDVIVFDEHLVHGSSGGRNRRQWRSDFIIDPARCGQEDIEAVQHWFAQSLPDELRDPGYDARQYPSYGGYWRSHHATWTARLINLDVLSEPTADHG